MTRNVTVAATQMACSWDRPANIARAEKLVRQAAARGAQIILIQELFETPTSARSRTRTTCSWPPRSRRTPPSPTSRPSPGSCRWYCRSASSNAPGAPASTASRSSTPMAATSGSTARATSRTARATTRSTTSIRATPASRSGRPATHGSASVSAGTSGSPNRRAAWPCSARNSCSTRPPSVANRTTPASGSRDHWQRVQQGHAGANLMPLVASNRIGREEQDGYDITFYGSSFIADPFGEKVEEPEPHRGRYPCPHLRPRCAGAHPQRLGRVPRPPAEPLRSAEDPGRFAGVLRPRETIRAGTPRAFRAGVRRA